MNRNRVFNRSDWYPTADGVWEARATPADLNSPPLFEATCRAGYQQWHWSLYQPINDHHAAALELTADGEAHTLAEAQRRTDHIARLWRDQPTGMAALARLDQYSEHSLLTCDSCGAAHRLDELLLNSAEGYCEAVQPDNGLCCDSTRFDGFTIDDLAEAVTV